MIKNLTQITKGDTGAAGGKGASLGEMLNTGIPVPPGFVVLSSAFERFLEITDLNVEINAVLRTVDLKKVHTVDDASEKIKALILGAKMPEALAEKVLKSFKDLGTKYVAVRSSATAEDSSTAAWAGQLESYLNTTKDTLLENIKKCWASLFTPRAIFYRFEKNLDKQDISVAVVVQKMVESEVSGIAFSVHPVTQDHEQIIIEASFGLGEAIVAGKVTPDSYVVNKKSWKIIDKNVNTQSKMLVRGATGGIKWQDIPEDQGEEPVLTDEEIIELSKLIVKIENHYGFPVDVEWARENGKFYIVQSRPITTLTSKGEEKDDPVVFDKFLSRPYSMLQIEAYNQFLTEISKEIDYPVTRPIFVYDPAKKLVHLYYNMKEFLPAIGKIGEKMTKDIKFRRKIFSELLRVFELIKKYFDGELSIKSTEELQDFFGLFKDYTKYVAYTWVLPGLDFVPKEIRDESMKLRKRTEDYAGRRDTIMINFANSIINNEQVDSFFLSLDEIKKRTNDIAEKSKNRKDGFLFYNGEIVLSNEIPAFLESHNAVLKDPEVSDSSEIKGVVAQKGFVKGIARIIYTEEELSRINEGDILVTPMTRPDFIPAMKKAAAFVTDEGGITCHAAIIAREMKKSCIIGTKTATEVLKDGDEIEVDADKGVVKIIKRSLD